MLTFEPIPALSTNILNVVGTTQLTKRTKKSKELGGKLLAKQTVAASKGRRCLGIQTAAAIFLIQQSSGKIPSLVPFSKDGGIV